MNTNIIKKLYAAISPKYREQLQAQKRLTESKAADEAYKAHIAAATQYNENLLQIIVDNCSKGQLIHIKFPCGNWTEKMLRDEVPNLIKVVTESGHWAYAHGGGMIVIDPDTYSRNPGRIAQAIWEPTRFLTGERISSWRYVEKAN